MSGWIKVLQGLLLRRELPCERNQSVHGRRLRGHLWLSRRTGQLLRR